MLEFLKQPGIYECCLVLSGMLSYRMLAAALRYKELHKLTIKTIEACLNMINIFYLDMRASLLAFKDESLKSELYSKEEKKIVINEYADAEATVDQWYKKSLQILEENIPKEFHIVITPKEKK